jgi:hypothetical protein
MTYVRLAVLANGTDNECMDMKTSG